MLLFFSWKVQIAVKHFNFNRSKEWLQRKSALLLKGAHYTRILPLVQQMHQNKLFFLAFISVQTSFIPSLFWLAALDKQV